MKKILVIVGALLFSIGAFSQIKFGVKLGPNFNTYSFDQSGVTTNYGVGFQGGLIGEIGIGPLQLETGAAYNQFKSKITMSTFIPIIGAISMENVQTIHQVEVPLMFGFQMGLEALSFVPQIGAVVNYALAGSATTTSNGQSDTDKIDFGTGTNEMNPMDYSLRMGFKLQVTKLRVGAYYNLGLANLSNDNSAKTNTRSILVSAALMF